MAAGGRGRRVPGLPGAAGGAGPPAAAFRAVGGRGSRGVPVTEQWRPRSVSGPSGTLATCRVCGREAAGVGPRSCAVDPGSLRVLSPLAWYLFSRSRLAA